MTKDASKNDIIANAKPYFLHGRPCFNYIEDALRFCIAQRALDGRNWQAVPLSSYWPTTSSAYAAVVRDGAADTHELRHAEKLGDPATGLSIEFVHSRHSLTGDAINAYMSDVIDGRLLEVRINGEEKTRHFMEAVVDHIVDTIGTDPADIEEFFPEVFTHAEDYVRAKVSEAAEAAAEDRSHRRAMMRERI